MIDPDPPVSAERSWPERLQWWRRAAGIVVLGAVITVVGPRPGLDAAGVGAGVLLLAGVASGLLIRIADLRPMHRAWRVAGLAVLGTCGVAYTWVDANSPGLVFLLLAAAYAGATLTQWTASAVTLVLVVSGVAGLLVHSRTTLAIVLVPVAAATLLGGMVRRTYTERVENAELALAQAERARAAENRSGALAERSRIAREIHDVLAHSLAALSMQLEAAEAVLEAGDTERARQAIAQARTLARDGMSETRQAIAALRSGLAPLPVALSELAGAAGAGTTVTVSGTVVDLDAQTRLVLHRAAQEALANAHKHAPGAATALDLTFEPRLVALSITNGPGSGPGAGTGTGMGLIGMAERAESLGGTVQAGPLESGGWRVRVQIPLPAAATGPAGEPQPGDRVTIYEESR